MRFCRFVDDAADTFAREVLSLACSSYPRDDFKGSSHRRPTRFVVGPERVEHHHTVVDESLWIVVFHSDRGGEYFRGKRLCQVFHTVESIGVDQCIDEPIRCCPETRSQNWLLHSGPYSARLLS